MTATSKPASLKLFFIRSMGMYSQPFSLPTAGGMLVTT